MKPFIILVILPLIVPSPLHAARISSITVCERVAEPGTVPMNVKDKFSTDTEEIHAVIELHEADPGTMLKGTWVSVDATEPSNYEIDSEELLVRKQGPTKAHFSLSRPDKGWPEGNYRLDFYINEKLTTTAPFIIRAAPGHSPLQSSGSGASQSLPDSFPSELLGNWQCQSQTGPGKLVIHPQRRLVINDQDFAYALLPGNVLRLEDQSGFKDYSYAQENDEFSMTYADGWKLQCQRAR